MGGSVRAEARKPLHTVELRRHIASKPLFPSQPLRFSKRTIPRTGKPRRRWELKLGRPTDTPAVGQRVAGDG